MPSTPLHLDRRTLMRVLLALMFGNVVIGTGVMIVPGTLNDIARSMQVSVGLAGQLISAAGLFMCIAAPVLAMVVGRWDRRWLLPAVMLWYAATHFLCLAAQSYTQLLLLRLLAMVGPALFTPQAAAAVSQIVPVAKRARAMSLVFLGWSVALVLGMPLGAWLGNTWGWRTAFALIGVLALLNGLWLWRVLPGPIRPAPMSMAAWGRTFGNKVLMQCVAVTLVTGSGQFVLFAYLAPYLERYMAATPGELAFFYACNGILGFVGMILLTRRIDRTGPASVVTLSLWAFAFSAVAWGWASSVWLAVITMAGWSLVGFAWNASQQARLVPIAPEVASASIALNTSAIYLSQAVGAGIGGWLIVQGHMPELHWVTLCFIVGAILLNRHLRRTHGV
ncbi:MAG: MFS transporter [Gammaproteobacteria bacterium]|nr:MFS transporter [Gammaproteobacteria bacterium]MBU0785498.1 MFS transporter [Gammaproteobacteria bacterium]MBU0813698.1 MFS transporter [Gammaproteobacteria bacterium]MBU1788830.1 MFS transporter [Gammaproteobacteria bacterium]